MAGPFSFGKGKMKRTKDAVVSSEVASTESRSLNAPARLAPTEVTSPVQTHDSLLPESSTQLSDQTLPPRRRGKTRGVTVEKLNASRGEKISVEILEEFGRPTDIHEARNLQTMIGLAARQDLPLTKEFRLLSEEERVAAYDRIKSRINVKGFGIHPYVKRAVPKRLSKARRDFLCRLKKKWEKEGDKTKPADMSIDDWEMLKDKWTSKEHKEKCKRNKEIRVTHVKNMHNSGSTSFVVRRQQISMEKLNGEPCGEFLLFLHTHFTQDPSGELDPTSVTGYKGKWVSEVAEMNYKKMVAMMEESKAKGTDLTEAQICKTVLKTEHRTDYTIGIGYGPSPQPKRHSSHVSREEFEEMLRVERAERAEILRKSQEEKEELHRKFQQERIEMKEEIRKELQEEMQHELKSMMMSFLASQFQSNGLTTPSQPFSGERPSQDHRMDQPSASTTRRMHD